MANHLRYRYESRTHPAKSKVMVVNLTGYGVVQRPASVDGHKMHPPASFSDCIGERYHNPLSTTASARIWGKTARIAMNRTIRVR